MNTKRMIREISILGYFVFLFMFIVGTYTTNITSHIILASTELPSYNIFKFSQSIANFFFVLMGKSTYFMVLSFFPLLLGLLFQSQKYLIIACRVSISILSMTILSGIFSPSSEWIEGGIIGSFSNDLFPGIFSHLFITVILCSFLFYQFYSIVSELVDTLSHPLSWKNYFYKKINRKYKNIESYPQDEIIEQKVLPTYYQVPLLLENLAQVEQMDIDSIEELLKSLEQDEAKLELAQIYSYIHSPDQFGQLLGQFVNNVYQVQKDQLQQIQTEQPKTSLSINSLEEVVLEDDTVINENIVLEYPQDITENKDNPLLVDSNISVQNTHSWGNSIVENMVDLTSTYLSDQFSIKERLDDVFSSLHASFSLPLLTTSPMDSYGDSISSAIEFTKKKYDIHAENFSKVDENIPNTTSSEEIIYKDILNGEKLSGESIIEEDTIDESTVYMNSLIDNYFENKNFLASDEKIVEKVHQAKVNIQKDVPIADINDMSIQITEEEYAYLMQEFPHENSDSDTEFSPNNNQKIDKLVVEDSQYLYDVENNKEEIDYATIIDNSLLLDEYSDIYDEENDREESLLNNEDIDDISLMEQELSSIQENIDVNNHFELPNIDLLDLSPVIDTIGSQEEKMYIGQQIVDILQEFNIQAELDKIIVGPVVTRYEIKPPKGLKVGKITELDNNIALGLASKDRIRIEAPVFGKSVVGIEVPNTVREMVTFRDVAEIFETEYNKEDYHIPFLMGKSLDGDILIKDLVKMPHLLIAGSTGSGKSVCVNTLINSILYYKTPAEVKLLLVDPKRVELILYDGLPHLITPVIKETPEAIKALKWLVNHMEERYSILEEKQVRNILEYNQMQEEQNLEKMPYIVVIMDEFADLILLGKREVEESVIRLAAMARAVGIHLVLATQRPSADVITGLIKANFPSRIAFKVSSKMESRIILDENGAENLLGKGDMLFLSADGGAMTQRIQSPLMSDEEVRDTSKFFKDRYKSQYWDDVIEDSLEMDSTDTDIEDEPLFKEGVDIILREKKASASYLQRRLKIGYNRAARMIESMEELGIISRANGSKPREVLIEEWEW